jgi:dipeptidyl aminopeptidase/acylaminoacyl peptidase
MKPFGFFVVSHNKKWVIYTISMSIRYRVDQEIKPRSFLMNLETGESKEIFADPKWKPSAFRWAADDTGFYVGMEYCTHPRYIMVSVTKIYWYPLDTGAYKEVDLQWDRYGLNPVPTANGFIIALLNGVHLKYARFYKKGDTWKRQWIKGEVQKNIWSVHLAEDGKTMIYSYSTASLPPRFYLAELKGNQFNKIA